MCRCGGTTLSYFKFEKEVRKEDPISQYLFVLVLEIVFIMIKYNQNTQPTYVFDYNYLLSKTKILLQKY